MLHRLSFSLFFSLTQSTQAIRGNLIDSFKLLMDLSHHRQVATRSVYSIQREREREKINLNLQLPLNSVDSNLGKLFNLQAYLTFNLLC